MSPSDNVIWFLAVLMYATDIACNKPQCQHFDMFVAVIMQQDWSLPITKVPIECHDLMHAQLKFSCMHACTYTEHMQRFLKSSCFISY